MDSIIKSDAKQRKQSGTEDEFKEKEKLLESLRNRFTEKDVQQKANARQKEKENREKGEKLRDDALQTLKGKIRSTSTRGDSEDEFGKSRKRKMIDLEKVWTDKKAMKEEELKLRDRELQLRERELALQEKKAQQVDDAQQMNKMQLEMMNKQMQQMADLISLVTKKF